MIPLQMDVIDEEAVKHIENIDGQPDILVNNAGFTGYLHDPDFFAKELAVTDPLELESMQNWADIFTLNTIAPFFVIPCDPTSSHQRSGFPLPRHVKRHQHQQRCGIT